MGILKSVTLFVFSGLLILAGSQVFADTSPDENKAKTIEINASEQKKIEKTKELKPVAKVEEVGRHIPEIPQPVTREHLSGADQVKLDDLEDRHASGKITQTEYELEKDTLARRANIKF